MAWSSSERKEIPDLVAKIGTDDAAQARLIQGSKVDAGSHINREVASELAKAFGNNHPHMKEIFETIEQLDGECRRRALSNVAKNSGFFKGVPQEYVDLANSKLEFFIEQQVTLGNKESLKMLEEMASDYALPRNILSKARNEMIKLQKAVSPRPPKKQYKESIKLVSASDLMIDDNWTDCYVSLERSTQGGYLTINANFSNSKSQQSVKITGKTEEEATDLINKLEAAGFDRVSNSVQREWIYSNYKRQ